MTKVYGLKVCSVENPFGIDSAPRFSWKMSSDMVGEKQTAYEVTVFENKKAIWTSGKVNGSKHSGIVCDAELKPCTSYEWSVVAYGKNGTATEPAVSGFVTGLMNSGWSGAEWISAKCDENFENVKNYSVEVVGGFDRHLKIMLAGNSHRQYYRFDIGCHKEGFYVVPYYFDCDTEREGFRCSTGKADIGAILGITPEDASKHRYNVKLNVTPDKIELYIDGKYISTVEITEDMPKTVLGRPGFHVDGGAKVWLKKLNITDNDTGKVLFSRDFLKDNVFYCGEIEGDELLIFGSGRLFMDAESFAARKEFFCKSKPVSAKLYVSGLGVFTSYINGKLTENTVDGKSFAYQLMPGSTEPRIRRQYFTYEISDSLNEGVNTLSAIVTSGWWSDLICNCHGSKNGFLAKLVLTYGDGSEDTIITDNSWKADIKNCPNGYTSIFSGEIYDARIGLDFTRNGYDDSEWPNACINNEFVGEITTGIKGAVYERTELEHPATDLVVYREVTGATETEYGTIKVDRHVELSETSSEFTLHAGETAVLDFGVNLTGRECFTVVAKEGTLITFCHGEALNDCNGLKERFCSGPEGSVWRKNLVPLSPAVTYYTCRDGEQTFIPRHTFYGYRYGEITVSDTVVFKKVTSQVITSVLHDSGKIKTSNELINKFCDNVYRGQLSNYLSVPTDCPQRAERVGWTADTQVFAPTASYFSVDTYPFLTKWLGDARDCQAQDGRYMSGSPRGRTGGSLGTFGWADAGVLVPYYLYRMFGDDEIIYENYDAMKKYVDVYLASTNKKGGNCRYGDWLSPHGNDVEMREELAAAFYAWVARCMSELAAAIGKNDDAKRYLELYEDEKKYFVETYVEPNGDLKYMTYTAVLYALHVDLIDDKKIVDKYVKYLKETVENDGYRVQTGFLGTSIVLPVLSRLGLTDLAYRKLVCTKNPSWLYEVLEGATTIWEYWDAYTKEKGFAHGFISLNHYSFGAAAEWIYSFAAGIKPVHAFDEFEISPEPNRAIDSIAVEYESESGKIVSAWKYEGDSLIFNIEIPANTSAKIKLPCGADKIVSVSGKEGIISTENGEGYTELFAVCGNYTIVTKVK